MLISLLTEPEYLVCENCPPYDPNDAVEGEKASQDNQIALKPVVDPVVILMVNLLPWRLVGDTEIWRVDEETSKPLMKTRMTGVSPALNGEAI